MIILLFTKFMVFTLAGSLTARSPQRDSDVSDTVSSPRRRFDGVVTIFRRKVGEMWVWVLACDAGQAAEHAMGRGPRAYAAPSKCMVSSLRPKCAKDRGGDGDGGDGGDGWWWW